MKPVQPQKGAVPAHTALPKFPKNHAPVNLATLASFQAGLRVRTYQIKPTADVAIIRKRDIVKGQLKYELEHATFREFPRNHALQAGDVVLHSHFGTYTPIVIDEPGETMVCAAPLVLIRILDKAALLPEYLAWYLRTSAGHQTLAAYEKQDKPVYAAIEGLYAVRLAKPRPEAQRLISGIARLFREFQEHAQLVGLDSFNVEDSATFEGILCRLAQF